LAARKYDSASTPDKTRRFPGWPESNFVSPEGDFQKITRTNAKFLPQMLGKDHPASFIYGDEHFFHTILKYHYHFEMATVI
jgi:hypothetical protein